jgi:hypothetical protein
MGERRSESLLWREVRKHVVQSQHADKWHSWRLSVVWRQSHAEWAQSARAALRPNSSGNKNIA